MVVFLFSCFLNRQQEEPMPGFEATEEQVLLWEQPRAQARKKCCWLCWGAKNRPGLITPGRRRNEADSVFPSLVLGQQCSIAAWWGGCSTQTCEGVICSWNCVLGSRLMTKFQLFPWEQIAQKPSAIGCPKAWVSILSTDLKYTASMKTEETTNACLNRNFT